MKKGGWLDIAIPLAIGISAGYFIGARARVSVPFASAGADLSHTDAQSSGDERMATGRPPVNLMFASGLSCEGAPEGMPLSVWEISCAGRRLTISGNSPPQFQLPEAVLQSNPSHLVVQVPGWNRVEFKMPPITENGVGEVHSPIVLRREMAKLCLSIPAVGTDYDTAELQWLRPLDDEPLAPPPAKGPLVIPLDFKAAESCASMPTGFYKLVLKSRIPNRVRDYALLPEVAMHAVREHDGAASVSVSLPPSLSRTYAGFGGMSMAPQSGESLMGIFCGLNINLKENTGDFVIVFSAMDREQTVRYATMKPRPDTDWPISNIYLEEPTRLSFDCPLSHADHRMTVFAEDGRITVVPTFIAPDGEQQQEDMFSRMRALIQAQVRTAARHPTWFDSRYANALPEELPNFVNLVSRERFGNHLNRISQNPPKPFELGSQVTVRPSGEGAEGWSVKVGRP